MGAFARYCIVFLLVVYALLSVLSAASGLWHQRGTLGMSTDYGANVRAVDAGGPADGAGIAAGDRVDLKATAFDQRRNVAGIGAPLPVGATVRFRVVHDGVGRDVALVAVGQELTNSDRTSLLLQCVASLVFVVVGASLILLRPSPATWGFGLYCLIDLPTSAVPFRFASGAITFAAVALFDVVQNLGVVGLLVFALDFPRRADTPWRLRLRRSLPVVFLVMAAATLYPDVANLVLGVSAELENHLLQIAFGVLFLTSLSILSDTYLRVEPDERERLRWVLIGFSLGLMTYYLGVTLIFSSLIAFTPPLWVSTVLVSLNVLLPLTVAHAVIRHRVLDINVVVSRALVYAALTTVLAALFGLLDWLFGSFLGEFHLSRIAEAALAISIAFAFDHLHTWTENIVEAVFFRKRRAAEARLSRLAGDVIHARSETVIETVLVDESRETLDLSSAALYERDAAGSFVRTASHGWGDTDCRTLDDADLLVLSLRSRMRPIKLAELPWHHDALPRAGLAPLIAIPMHARGDLIGLMLYGAHVDGSDIDASEIAQLERVTHAARVALDELEADRLRVKASEQNATIAALQARLDELRRALSAPKAREPEPG